MLSFSLICLYISSYIICQTSTQTILSTGDTNDDWNGWNNGEISSSTSINKQYHGIFDGDDGETTLSRNDIELETSGILIMNFTLIFACQVIDNTDKITVSIGSTPEEYYFTDTLDEYSQIDDILFPLCNNSVWSIQSSIQSTTYDANTPIHNISFISTFNYEIPYDQSDKYWAVTDIIFTLQTTNFLDAVDTNNNATIISIIVVLVILFILLVILFRYLYKSRKIRKRKKKHSYKSIQLSQKELVKNTTKNKKKSKKQKKTNAAILNENKSLKAELEELQLVNNQLSVRKMNKDNQINEAMIKIQNMRQVIMNLENNIHEIKKTNANKTLELMRKDEQINKQMKEQAIITEKLNEIKSRKYKDEKKITSDKPPAVIAKNVPAHVPILSEVNAEWMSLESCPVNENIQLFPVNYSQFGAVSMETVKIHKYKTKDKWNFFMKISKKYKSTYWMVCGDRRRELIYVYGNLGEMVIIDSKGKIDAIAGLDNIILNGGKCIMMNGNIHIFGGNGSNWHLLWNSKIKMLKKINMNYGGLGPQCEYYLNFEAVGLWKREMLLMFGGCFDGVCTDNIWKYDIYKCLWQSLKVKLPFKMHSFSCVVTDDEGYVIIFGGVREGDKYIDDIFVLDVNDMSLKRSDVKCPVKGKIKGLLMDYGEEYKLLLSWLVRENVHEKVGEDVFDMMMRWIVTNDVHLIDSNDGRHWRMNVGHIVGVYK